MHVTNVDNYPKCYSDANACECSASSTKICTDNKLVCCVTSYPAAPGTCNSSPAGCLCDAISGTPCGPGAPVCCKKNIDQYPKCYSDGNGCS